MGSTSASRPVHPAAERFPMIEGSAYEEFREDIRTHGLRVPIATLPDGTILDGRNRLKACEEVGIEPVFEIVSTESPMAYVLSANKHRRHLTSSQLAILAADEVPNLRPEAEDKRREAAKEGGRTAGNGRSSHGKKVSHGNSGGDRYPKTVEKAAAMFGTNSDYVQTALTLKANAPDLAEKVLGGEMTIRAAQIECGERTGKRAEIRANAAIQRAAEWVGYIEGVAGYCKNVSVDAVRSDKRLRRHWEESCGSAISAIRDFLKRLKG